ncbi:RNA polymerase sigma factor [Methylibium rhizosphaerae]|uniref:RNA polymerase sigma factor n=1 Tax=Methylibium rhizosphaerae TaxID=2570323 RepID=UPI001128A44C|nr:RNA polymerase sigma factor [Methylibium rhizosphaerae]
MKGNEEQLLQEVDAALAGSEAALRRVVEAVQHDVFRLALRLLGHFADAQDATQEILIRVVTSLATFERRSTLRTWVYSIATNHLRDAARKRRSQAAASLDDMTRQLDAGLAVTRQHPLPAADCADPTLRLEAREVGLRCTQGMLMCLDVEHRLALVLGEIFALDTAQGAEVLGISPAAYRQRLSRGRRRLEAFLRGRCGLADASAECSCERQAAALRVQRGGRPLRIEFCAGGDDVAGEPLQQAHGELKLLWRLAAVMRSAPQWQAPQAVTERLREVIAASTLLGRQ